jgi:hypothetical protein
MPCAPLTHIHLYEVSFAACLPLDISCIFNYVTLFNLFYFRLCRESESSRSITTRRTDVCAKWNYYSLSTRACYPSTYFFLVVKVQSDWHQFCIQCVPFLTILNVQCDVNSNDILHKFAPQMESRVLFVETHLIIHPLHSLVLTVECRKIAKLYFNFNQIKNKVANLTNSLKRYNQPQKNRLYLT